MGPLRGDGNLEKLYGVDVCLVEKMGPLRGDGNVVFTGFVGCADCVEKMGPLRGDGNTSDRIVYNFSMYGREDGSPSWGRKHLSRL